MIGSSRPGWNEEVWKARAQDKEKLFDLQGSEKIVCFRGMKKEEDGS